MRKVKEAKELEGCTFAPQIKPKKAAQAATTTASKAQKAENEDGEEE